MKTIVGLTSVGVALVSGMGCSASHQPPDATPRSAPASPVQGEPRTEAGDGRRPSEREAEPPPFPTIALPDVAPAGREPSADGSSAGPWTGLLRTGVMAIGGETTGMTLTTDGGIFELRATGALLNALQAADGRRITIEGHRRDVTGVESRRVRRIIDVSAIVTP